MGITTDVCLVTSLVPEQRIDIQLEAVQSWREYGFEICSLNTASEIDKLVQEFSDVRFVPQLRNGRIIAGKPVIYINDILNYLQESRHKMCGIINSDIYLAPGYEIRERIKTAVAGNLLISPRTDVSSFTAVYGVPDPFGFDAFFFEREMIPIWKESQFCLGMPFWDHWFAVIPILNKKRVTKLVSSGIRHIPHSVSRDESFFFFNDHFARQMISYINNNQVGFGLEFDHRPYETLRTAALESEVTSINQEAKTLHLEKLAIFFDNLTKYVIRFIDERSEKIKF